jgi:hypothetical protein
LVHKQIFIGAAIAFGVAAAIVVPAGAEPSPFGALGCSCEPPTSPPESAAPGTNQTNQGIQNGLNYLRANPRR